MNALLLTMISMQLATGMGAALVGSVKVPLARRLSIDEARVGGLVSLFGFTLVPVIFAAGFLTDLVGRHAVLLVGSTLLAASLVVLGAARSYLAALAGVVLLSSGWSLLINVGNVLTPAAFSADTRGMSYATNISNMIFGIGAFATPLAAALLMRRLALPATLTSFSAFALLPALLSWGIDFAAFSPASASSTEPAAPATANVLADPLLWWCGLALFFYGPLEASMAAWTTTYLGGQGYRETAAAGLLSAFWLTFVASRLLAALVLPPSHDTALILGLSLISVAVLAAMVLARGHAVPGAMVISAGAAFGPIFPSLVAILLNHVPEAQRGRAVGLLFAIGGVGWALIPIVIGACARKYGVRRAFAVAVGAAAALSGIALVLMARG